MRCVSWVRIERLGGLKRTHLWLFVDFLPFVRLSLSAVLMFSTYALARSLPLNTAGATMLRRPPRHPFELLSAFAGDLNRMSAAGYQLWRNVHTGEFRMCLCRVHDGCTRGACDGRFSTAQRSTHGCKRSTHRSVVPLKPKRGTLQRPFAAPRWPVP